MIDSLLIVVGSGIRRASVATISSHVIYMLCRRMFFGKDNTQVLRTSNTTELSVVLAFPPLFDSILAINERGRRFCCD